MIFWQLFRCEIPLKVTGIVNTYITHFLDFVNTHTTFYDQLVSQPTYMYFPTTNLHFNLAQNFRNIKNYVFSSKYLWLYFFEWLIDFLTTKIENKIDDLCLYFKVVFAVWRLKKATFFEGLLLTFLIIRNILDFRWGSIITLSFFVGWFGRLVVWLKERKIKRPFIYNGAKAL
jgi:hypothetical protein